jgi:hypothetical protein
MGRAATSRSHFVGIEQSPVGSDCLASSRESSPTTLPLRPAYRAATPALTPHNLGAQPAGRATSSQRLAPNPALAREAICRPFVIVRRVGEVRFAGRGRAAETICDLRDRKPSGSRKWRTGATARRRSVTRQARALSAVDGIALKLLSPFGVLVKLSASGGPQEADAELPQEPSRALPCRRCGCGAWPACPIRVVASMA